VIRPSPHTVVVAIAAVLIVGALAAGGWLWHAAGERRAMAAYAEALTEARAAKTSPGARLAAIRALEAVLAEYPSAPAASQAAYHLGDLRYDAGQYAAARSAWEIAVAKRTPPTVQSLALLGIGQAWEAERNFPKAIDAYQAGLTRLGPRDFLYEELLIDLARAQELAGRRDEAVASYRKILKELPGSRRGDDVRSRLASLGASP